MRLFTLSIAFSVLMPLLVWANLPPTALEVAQPMIKEMTWGVDLQIELTMENDSVYVYDVENLQRTQATTDTRFRDFTYYQTSLSDEFVDRLKTRGVEFGMDTTFSDTVSVPHDSILQKTASYNTLWSGINSYIGGGWIHFVNTLLYTIERGKLNLHSPLMKRPETRWKPPRPRSESYKRTRRWAYYTPTTQREAKREYNKKKDNDELGNLLYLPDDYIDLLLNTSQREYEKMRYYDRRSAAKIDLVKLLLGANYLGQFQINYIRNVVLRAVVQYGQSQLPSIIIFDNFNAAVAMTLDTEGYRIQKIVFSDEGYVTADEKRVREKAIQDIVGTINEVNQEIFRERLTRYYEP